VQLATKKLHATLGITMVLHTWTRELKFHPHVHAIVTAGGLTDDGQWIRRRGRFLFHVGVMGKLFRGKMMHRLRTLHAKGQFADFAAFADPMAFDALCAKVAKLNWNVYAKAPFAKSTHVLEYLARYTHRVGLANSRLLAVSPTEVSFKTKGDGVATVSPVEFLRRFVQHVLPDGFHKIRHYGLYHPALDVERSAAAALVGTLAPPSRDRPTRRELFFALTGRDLDLCPICEGQLTRGPLPDPQARAPPAREVA
jgi:hypothetical protein